MTKIIITGCKPKNKKADVSVVAKKRGSPATKKLSTKEFVLAYGSTMTNEEMAKKLGISRMKMAGTLTALKRIKAIDNNFLLTDVNEAKNTKKRGRKKGYIVGKYTNHNGANKEIARQKIVNAVKQSGILEGKIMSLPAETCTLELKLLQLSKNFAFDVCEHDKEIFKKLLKTIIKNDLNMAVNPRELSELIYKAKENEYAHLILDYCGNFNTHHREVETAMINKIVGINGKICLTFSQRDLGGGIIQEMNEINEPKEDETKTASAVKTFIELVGGRNYKIEEIFSYRDTHPMMLVVIKRIR